MIESSRLIPVRNGTCAIGYLTVPLTSFQEDFTQPYLKVVGTGFLVSPTTAITNRHVIEELKRMQDDLGFPDDQRMILFVGSKEGSQLQVTLRMIRAAVMQSDPNLDVGFLDFVREPTEQLEGINPVRIAEQWETIVTDRIAVCGYPYGHTMLQRDGKVYRWGPVVQQGFVSAVSPYDVLPTTGVPNEVLLDVRIAGGMSGAPIFRPDDGQVIGIIHSAWEATTGLGLPLTRPILDDWLSSWEAMKTQEGDTGH